MRLVSSVDLFDLMRGRLEQDPYAFSTHPRDEEAIADLAGLLARDPGAGLSVIAMNQRGREQWIWMVPERLAHIHWSIQDQDGGALMNRGPVEVYLAPNTARCLSQYVSGEEVAGHLVATADEVTDARLQQAGWLIRPVGMPLGSFSRGSRYRVSLDVRPLDPTQVPSERKDGVWLAILPKGREDESGADLALRMVGEQVRRDSPDHCDPAADLIKSLLGQASLVAMLPDPVGSLPPAPIFQPDLAGVALQALCVEAQRAR